MTNKIWFWTSSSKLIHYLQERNRFLGFIVCTMHDVDILIEDFDLHLFNEIWTYQKKKKEKKNEIEDLN